MDTLKIDPGDRKVYFASDFHLGVPSFEKSLERERRIVQWLDSIKRDAHSLFLLGDIFDFWFEYKKVVPKGFIRILGKLAELSDNGIKIYMFKGNHDMWMFDYFKQEIKAEIVSDNLSLSIGEIKLLVGHGDGLGPGDNFYKLLRKVFRNPVCQWLFGILPPRIGMGIAQIWSKKSRISNGSDEKFNEETEYLIQYCKEVEAVSHYDYYIFGHRHLVIDYAINESSKYLNLGEWVNDSQYAVYENGAVKIVKLNK